MIHLPSVKVVIDGANAQCKSCELTLLKKIVEHNGSSVSDSGFAVATLPLICPGNKTRIKIPVRFFDCRHLEVFDLEAYLQQEVLWPRLKCPICGLSSTGMDSVTVDYTLAMLLPLIPEHFRFIEISTEGNWRPLFSDQCHAEIKELTPIFGAYTESFAYFLKHGTYLPHHPPQPPILANGIPENNRYSPSQHQSQRASDIFPCNSSQPHLPPVAQPINNSNNYAITQPLKTELGANKKKRVLSTTQAPTNSLPGLLNIGVEGLHANPKSLPSTPTFPKNSPVDTKPGSSNDPKRSRGSSFGEDDTQNSLEIPTKKPLYAIVQLSQQPNDDPETIAALSELPNLSQLSRPDVLDAIFRLTSPKQFKS